MFTFLAYRLMPACLAVVLISFPLQRSVLAADEAPKEAAHKAVAAPADPHAGAGAHAAEEHGHGEKKGPITATKQDVDLAIWSLVVFVVFLVVLKKFAWVPMTEGLDKREAGILQNIADAESARIKAEKMLAAHAEKLSLVQDEVRQILATARKDADQARADIIAQAQKEAEASRQRAVNDIERARDLAMDELFTHLGRAVAEATEQVVGRALTSDDDQRLIQESLHAFSAGRNH